MIFFLLLASCQMRWDVSRCKLSPSLLFADHYGLHKAQFNCCDRVACCKLIANYPITPCLIKAWTRQKNRCSDEDCSCGNMPCCFSSSLLIWFILMFVSAVLRSCLWNRQIETMLSCLRSLWYCKHWTA